MKFFASVILFVLAASFFALGAVASTPAAPHFFPAAFVVVVAVAAAASVPTKIVAIAVAVYPILQLLKKVFPQISGVWAIVFNVALAIFGYLVTVQPAQLFSVDTLLALLSTVAAAAGIHGTIKSLTAAA